MTRRFAMILCVLAGTGCHSCREDHPYVPYSIGTGDAAVEAPHAAAAAPADAAVDASGDPFAGEPALQAPPGLQRWSVNGVSLEAPPGLVFVLGLVRDFDGDGAADAFAIVRPPDGNDPGQAVYYRGTGSSGTGLSPAAAFPPPPVLARGAACTPVARLEGIGKESVLVELGVQCAEYAAGAPSRWIAVLKGGKSPGVRLAATIADPPGAPSLTVGVVSADRDGDGLDDLAVRVAIEGGGAPLEPGPRVAATIVWLDRPAGLSRDTAAVSSSFASLAAVASARAARTKDAPGVPGYVAQVRALWRSVCAEGSSPRIVGVTGTGGAIACSASHALEDAGLAAVRAYVTMGDALRASLALDQAQRAPASRTASRALEALRWIERLAPAVSPRALRAVAAVPTIARGGAPAWGALAFEPSGKLLARTAAGVVRIDPDSGQEDAAGDVVDWKPVVASPDGAQRWIEAYDPCDGLSLRATFAAAGGDELRDVALPVPPSLAGRCAGSRGAPAQAVPIAWGPGGLEAIIEGQPVLISSDLAHASPLAAFLDQPTTPGAPRSPDGKTYVVATAAGLLVRAPSRTRLLRAPELDGSYAEQRDCAVSNDATHVACVRAGRAWVGAWEGP